MVSVDAGDCDQVVDVDDDAAVGRQVCAREPVARGRAGSLAAEGSCPEGWVEDVDFVGAVGFPDEVDVAEQRGIHVAERVALEGYAAVSVACALRSFSILSGNSLFEYS